MGWLASLRIWLAGVKPVRVEPVEQDRIHAWVQQTQQRWEQYAKMSTDELKDLPDNELAMAVQVRAERLVDSFGMEPAEQMAGFWDLSDAQRVVYTLSCYENEILNGGLCQFFINSSRMVAPYVSQSLASVGAEEHRMLLDGFIEKHEIDLDDLSSFISENEEAAEEQYDRYPFDEFDEAFSELETLETFLITYIKEHMDMV